MAERRVRVLVTGKVQGVYFRLTMKDVAGQNGVSGWVRNLDDGRVEAVIEGDDAGVGRVIEWCHAGPADARVDEVAVTDEAPAGMSSGFKVRE